MARFDCPIHGKIVSSRKEINFCPICGGKASRVYLFPSLYIEKGAAKIAASILAWPAGLAIAIVACILLSGFVSSCNKELAESDKIRKERYAQMNPTWHTLHVALREASGPEEVNIVKKFIEDNKATLATTPPITADELDLLLEGVTCDGEVIKHLTSYMASAATQPSVER